MSTHDDAAAVLAEPHCSCGRIKVGFTTTDHRNWNPDCESHGVLSTWYRSEEQVQARAEQSDRLKELYRKVKAARACSSHTGANCQCQESTP